MSDLKDFYAIVADAADQLDPVPPALVRRHGARRRRIRHSLVSGVAAVAVATAVGAIFIATNQQPTRPSPATESPRTSLEFAPPHQVGKGIGYGSGGRSGTGATVTSGDRGYAVWQAKTTNSVTLGALDLRTGQQLWAPQTIPGTGDSQSVGIVGDVVIVGVGQNAGSSPQGHTFGFDATTGKQLWHLAATLIITQDVVIATAPGKITGYNLRSGREVWHRAGSWFDVVPMESAADRHAGGLIVRADSRFGVMSPEMAWQLFDGRTGKALGRRTELGQDWEPLLASAGTLYISSYDAKAKASTISAVRDGATIPIRTLTGVINRYMTACWPQRICLTEVFAANTGDLTMIDTATDRELWRSPITVLGLARYTGELITVPLPGLNGGVARLAVYNGAGRPLNVETLPQTHVDVLASGSDVIILSGDRTATAETSTVRGMNASDGSTVKLGQLNITASSCSATPTRLLCLSDTSVTLWSIRA